MPDGNLILGGIIGLLVPPLLLGGMAFLGQAMWDRIYRTLFGQLDRQVSGIVTAQAAQTATLQRVEADTKHLRDNGHAVRRHLAQLDDELESVREEFRHHRQEVHHIA